MLLRPYPGVSDTKGLALIETAGANGEHLVATSYLDYRDYRDNLKLVSAIAIGRFTPLSVGSGQTAERAWAELVSANYFDVLGVVPLLGRSFLPEEGAHKPGAFPVAVISHRMWQNRFHGDRDVLGKTIRLNRHELTIIGVAPPDFRGTTVGLVYDVWMPITMAGEMGTGPVLSYRGCRDLTSTCEGGPPEPQGGTVLRYLQLIEVQILGSREPKPRPGRIIEMGGTPTGAVEPRARLTDQGSQQSATRHIVLPALASPVAIGTNDPRPRSGQEDLDVVLPVRRRAEPATLHAGSLRAEVFSGDWRSALHSLEGFAHEAGFSASRPQSTRNVQLAPCTYLFVHVIMPLRSCGSPGMRTRTGAISQSTKSVSRPPGSFLRIHSMSAVRTVSSKGRGVGRQWV